MSPPVSSPKDRSRRQKGASGERSRTQYIFPLAGKPRPLAKSQTNYLTSINPKEEEAAALQELGSRVYQMKECRSRTIYEKVADPALIAKFLASPQSGYDTRRKVWRMMPKNPATERDVRKPFVNMINAAIQFFYPSSTSSTSREAVDSHNIPLVHDNGALCTMPGICIKATGPSFETPEHEEPSNHLGYTNSAAVLEVRIEKDKGKRTEHCKRLAVMNR